MRSFHTQTAVEQVVAHLRKELVSGTWSGSMPGGDKLAKELGIGSNTVEVALQQLEKQGLLLGQGPRRRRLINLPGDLARSSLRVAILRFESDDVEVAGVAKIKHRLSEAGHSPFFPPKSLVDLNMDVTRVAGLVKKTEADAWVIVAGSHEVLKWFAAQPIPAFALFGRRHNVDIASAGPETSSTIATTVERLVELGHHRIVMLSRNARRLPTPAQFERAFLAELKTHGLGVGSYNLPDWEDTKEGFHQLLGSLFHLTPPTALIIHEAPQFTSVLRFLATLGLQTPKDVSLICTDPDRSFSWCEPPISHFTWDDNKVVNRVVRWVANINSGKEDRRPTHVKAGFFEGGTIGPAKA